MNLKHKNVLFPFVLPIPQPLADWPDNDEQDEFQPHLSIINYKEKLINYNGVEEIYFAYVTWTY